MKNFFTLVLFCFSILASNSSFLTINENLLLLDASKISVYLNSENQRALFLSADYSYEYENLLFDTYEKMDYIQIFNEKGILEREIPINAVHCQIPKQYFSSGKYMLAMKFFHRSKMEFINVQSKH